MSYPSGPATNQTHSKINKKKTQSHSEITEKKAVLIFLPQQITGYPK